MSKRDIKLLIKDIEISNSKILKYIKGLSYNSFIEDDKTIDAVIRNLEIIGEAANKIDNNFKIKNPQIDWNRIRGLRNRIVHDYFGIDYEIVWNIITDDLDELISQLKNLNVD